MSELETLTELAKRRGFFFSSNEAYGGTAGFYTYGPEGAALKRNLEDIWRDIFVRELGNMELEAPTVMPEAVFEASGHLDGFDDMIIECPECGATHRADHLVEDEIEDIEDAEAYEPTEVAELIATHHIECPSCGESLAGESVEEFNLMFGTNIGPGSSAPGYLRPETAQGIFVEFPRLKEYARNKLPFGVAQIGRAYRNEISPRRALVRVREFTQAELEHFIDPERDEPPIDRVADVELPLYSVANQNAENGGVETYTVAEAVDSGIIESEWVAYYLGRSMDFYERIGIDMDRFRYRQHLPGERAHYAADCWDAETELGGSWVEVTGFAYRSDYDLSKHGDYSKEEFTLFRQYDEPKTVERATVDPDMSYLGPEFGGAAGDIAAALESLAGRDRSAFDGDEVTVEVDGDEYTVPVERTGFAVEEQTEAGEHITPHVVEPSFGVGRLVYSVLVHSHGTDTVDDEERTYLDLPAELAPTTVAVFPLMTKDGLDDRAREVSETLREAGFEVAYDDTGNIGRRYRRQDEVGTPYCVTVDYETQEDGTVTIRERDSTDQTRVPVEGLPAAIAELVDGATLAEL
ncbi:glycine--tRNA ligase [Natronomonas pharaonis DSM 2160]|uniref:glycine--tRNA ligase n=1 Tax=Natronomonas pharaonis (strain ATCC 35678 / DSM 2160 / CIP 103997 / JCM 8858 / NBRC 14720 / NCIMB 2260 / Gabara) TaxID=348780 RepID=A0A1U7ETL2_NATPD|nr:glycine--tRNA ligase [Natronomonas pharaonis]CAI48255.1 glycine--tRNA ligase [Natronomonas pharaonis DSM 2160]